MIDFYGLFSVDAAYVFTGMAAVTLISLIIAIISICKTSSMKKKYKEFMSGSDGTSIEELIIWKMLIRLKNYLLRMKII
jgi:hypothetical protein